LDRFIKIAEVAQNLGRPFFLSIDYVSILTKKIVRLHFGPFFTNSSGHPDDDRGKL
jgi:hypothetical protein